VVVEEGGGIRIAEGVICRTQESLGTIERLNDLLSEVNGVRAELLSFQSAWTLDSSQAVAGVATTLTALGLAATTLSDSIGYMCDLVDPPEAIKGRPHGPNGDMAYQCFHDPAHCWNRGWKSITCP
jgi:hypothetical protein